MITVRDSGWRQHVRAVEASALHRARVGIFIVISVLFGGRSGKSPSPGRLLGVLGVGMLASLTACTDAPTGPSSGGSQAASAESQPPTVAASGEFAGPVDVGGGRTIYLECHGAGTPTVVLLSGWGNAGDVWQVTGASPPPVADGVAAFTHVCVYDRPGTYVTTVEKDGARAAVTSADSVTAARGTAVVSAPRTGGDVVAELHQLLAAAHVPGPYVLVGHSLGGLFALLYARTYPDQVSGIVLVDPTTPKTRDLVSPAQWALFERSGIDPGPSPIPGYVSETYRISATLDQLHAAGPMLRIPVTDLIKTIPQPYRGQLPYPGTAADHEAFENALPAAHAALIQSIPGSKLVPVPHTTHDIHGERPDVVISAIRDTTAGTTMTSTPTSTP